MGGGYVEGLDARVGLELLSDPTLHASYKNLECGITPRLYKNHAYCFLNSRDACNILCSMVTMMCKISCYLTKRWQGCSIRKHIMK